MKELPIPFQPPLARKTHRGEKTQTRRLRLICRPGDRLWVREAWRAPKEYDSLPPRDIPRGTPIHYEADGTWPGYGKLRPPMFMPRWMCRTLLEVTEVRTQRLQSISEADAIAEGVHADPGLRGDDDMMVMHVMQAIDLRAGSFMCASAPVARFVVLWDSINGRTPGANWASNPQVWAYTFRRVMP